MFNKLLHIAFTFALAATATAQNPYIQGNLQGGPPAPGTRSRSPLNSMERAANNLAGATILTDTFGNQRLALFVRIEDTCINYTPAATGNTQNLSAFVEKCSTDSVWYIDWEGKSVFIGGAGAVCDEDWLQISDNSCPDAITDSIYHQRYAAIGARLVWPSAEFLVSDSTAAQVTVLSGNRNSRLAFWDNFNAVYSTIEQAGTSSVWYISPIGEMRWTTAGGGTPQVPGAPFVNQFAINPADSPLPTIQAHQYPNTRSDTATVRNFLYTDPVGEFRSQPIDSLVVIVVDSIQADTTLQRNWYTHNGVTTDLLRVALVKRSAWWRGLDSLGFFRFSVRPDLVNGTQFTIFQDSMVVDADTIVWESTWHPALQYHDLQSDATYFHADSLKVVGIGQFAAFPSLNFDGTEKGFIYDLNDFGGVGMINGDGGTGQYTYALMENDGFITYSDYDGTGDRNSSLAVKTSNSNVFLLASTSEVGSPYSGVNWLLTSGINASSNKFEVILGARDTNESAVMRIGHFSSDRRQWNIATNFTTSEFSWIASFIPNDTTENAVSFYNRAYYWKNEHPTGAAGDTLFHFWAATGPGGEAGKDPGFMTLDDIRGGGVNWYNSNGTTTDNTRIATVTETATWLSDDVAVDGVYPFRFELDGLEVNEPEMMVWKFPAPNNDSLMLNQSDQEITFRSTNRFLLWSNEAVILLGDSIQAQGIADKTKIRRLLGLGGANSIQAFDADAVAAGTILKSDATDWTYGDWLTTFSSATQATSAWTVTNAATDVNAAIVPKGTGAITADMPDGTTTGGNARGATAVDLQHTRDAATQVASGTHSGLFAGRRNTVSGTGAVILGGADNIASGDGSFIIGGYTGASVGGAHVVSGSNSGILGGVQDTVTGNNAFAMGAQSVASATYSTATGALARAYLTGQRAHAVTTFVADNPGFCQSSTLVESRAVTGTGQTELFLDGSAAQAVLLGTNRAWNFKIDITGICSTVGNGVGITAGDTWASWHVGGIKRLNTTTTLVGTVQNPSTAQSDAGMSTTTVTIDADDTTEALRIRITPPSTAGTTTVTRWVATISLTESAY